jgi:hypothetical protein
MSNSKKSIFKPAAIPLYRSTFFIAVNISDIKLKEELEKHVDCERIIKSLVKHSRITDHEQAVTAYKEGFSIIRYKTLKDAQDINSIAHEAFHVVCNITRYVGITLSEDSEEAFAYLLGYITEQYEDILKLEP